MYCANFITAASYPGCNTNEDCTLIDSDLKSCNYFLKFWRAVGIWKVVGIKEEFFIISILWSNWGFCGQLSDWGSLWQLLWISRERKRAAGVFLLVQNFYGLLALIFFWDRTDLRHPKLWSSFGSKIRVSNLRQQVVNEDFGGQL